MGVKGYAQPISIPVGYETVIEMFPIDFEEFLWANEMDISIINLFKKCLTEEKPVPSAIHEKMKELLLQYVAVGGMPDIVQTFIKTKQMNEVLRVQRDILILTKMIWLNMPKEKINRG